MALDKVGSSHWGLRSLASSAARQIAGRGVAAPPAGKYNITASQANKFLWFRVAKVGTRTIYNRLKESGAELSIEHVFGRTHVPAEYADCFKFAFVRNPWDRLVSCWLNKIVGKNAFDLSEADHARMQDFAVFVDWVEAQGVVASDIHIRSQSSLIDLNQCDFFGRMESFEDDLAFVFQRIGLPTDSRTVRNQSPDRKPFQDYYTPAMVDQVARIYSKDVRLFGYRFEG